MRAFHQQLLSSVLLPLLSVSAMAQLHELGTGTPGVVQAPHLNAELIAGSGTITPGGTSHVELAITMGPGWYVYWMCAGD